MIVLDGATSIDAATIAAVKCQGAIIKTTAGFVQARTKALQKCAQSIVTGKLPPGTDCHADVGTTTAITKASAKLTASIVKTCAGADRSCGTHDANEPTLAEIGWNIGSCPNVEGGNCINPINSCSDITSCVECISGAVVDQAIALYYAALNQTDPNAQKDLNRCQVAIGKAATAFLAAKAKTLAKCWAAVNNGKATAPCPAPGDGKAGVAIAAAWAKQEAAIKKVCQGPDQTFGTADDFTPAQIGFPLNCLDATVPTCAGPVGTLQQLIDCVDCVTERDVDCADRAAVPAFVSPYPAQCDPTPREGAIVWFRATTAASTTVQYHLSVSSPTAATTELPLPFDFRASHLYVTCANAITSGTQTFTVVKNGTADPTLECAMTSGAKTCNDTSGTIDFNAATDTLTFQSVGSGSATAPMCVGAVEITDQSGNAYDAIVGGGDNGAPADGAFCGLGFHDAGACTRTTATDVGWVAPVGGTLTGLAVGVDATIAPGSSQTYTVRNVTQGVDTDLVATLTGTLTGPSITLATTCTSHCAYSRGDVLAVKFNKTGPQSTTMRRVWSVTHSAVGQIFGDRNSSGYNNIVDRFVGIYDGWHNGTNTGDAWPIPRSGTLRNLFVTAPFTTTQDLTMTVCKSAAGATPDCALADHLTCTLTTGSASCSDASNTMAVNAGDQIQLWYHAADTLPAVGAGALGATIEITP